MNSGQVCPLNPILAVINPLIAALLLLGYQKHFRSTSGRRKICGEYGFSSVYSPEKAGFMSYRILFYSPSTDVLKFNMILFCRCGRTSASSVEPWPRSFFRGHPPSPKAMAGQAGHGYSSSGAKCRQKL
jgi:hypothetical protein